ncbi:hypothetical protein CONLIGDRAFT_630818 [Coniochaeta ligniaria NRRL 30616]|uniref:Xylanolytic transcriptional activator regulatory domain-containing protein n=1 Tax=Coniochaeta ligniaria NRRL 30616 TaxID=1408157 RepID=A0A1J7JC76_9PEZI|nr:hypothetical protein CONLIGDRAFT_630818 [Coniochaeta ligniaria NRRL 30616]
MGPSLICFSPDYGYACRYNREIKKRGRVPMSLAASGRSETSRRSSSLVAENQQNGHSHSSPLTPPDGTPPTPEYARQNIIGLATIDRVQTHNETDGLESHPPAAGHAQPNQATPTLSSVAAAPYLSPTGYAPPHTHLQLSSLLDPSADSSHILPRSHGSPPGLPAVSGSESSVGYPSPANGLLSHQPSAPTPHHRGSFGASMVQGRGRGSFSTNGREGSIPELHGFNSLYKAPSSDCRYRLLDPVLPYLRDIIPASVAADLLDVYLTEPGSSLFRCASPYILTRIFRKKSMLHDTHPRHTTPALLATMLWCAAQTADIVLLHVPGSRAKITNALYDLATSLISERDPDRWRRAHGGLRFESDQPQPLQFGYSSALPTTTETNEPAGLLDDVLTFVLLSIAVSGGDFKSDCFKWWSKAIRLMTALKLNREDERCLATVSPCANPLCSCRRDLEGESPATAEAREERRRVFWLIYCLDRHLSLSFNTVPDIPDSYCQVYTPLPEAVWENLDTIPPSELPRRVMGPPTKVSGTGFFEYFLPLMAILGDIIEVHHRRQHPRLGSLDDSAAVSLISQQLQNCELSLDTLAREAEASDYTSSSLSSTNPSIKNLITGGIPITPGGGGAPPPPPTPGHRAKDRSRLQLVTAYSTLILHVLHVLLHGKWDAISMLDDSDDWITSTRFNECASHAIAASQAVSSILKSDPELTFMPYLFGIYLLHGSFILLLFADRMPQLGPNQSVEQACETIIRAHEVCVVTLSTEFQVCMACLTAWRWRPELIIGGRKTSARC